jgi:hypothetical protein
MNSEIMYNDERYHIQTESWAPEENVLVTQVFRGGQVVLKKKFRPKTERDAIFDEKTINKAHDLAITELQDLFI